MPNDIRVGLRLLWKDKAFTLATVTTLAVCIGANVAVFAIVDHVLLRPLPWPDADRIVLMANQYPGAGVSVSSNSGVPDYYDRLRETTVFKEQALYNSGSVAIDQDGSPTLVRLMNVTPSFFRVICVAPAIGRTFTDNEGEIGNELVVVLSYGLWQSAFGGDPSAVGRDLRLDGRPYMVVGVMPHSFTFLDDAVRLWRPLAFTPEQRSDGRRHNNSWRNIALLTPGASVVQAQREIDELNTRNLERFPQYRELLVNAGFRTSVVRLQDDIVRDVKPTLFLLWGGALVVLLIGSLNVGNLVLVRTSARLRELMVRIALGAGRWRIARQFVAEGLLLTTISAIAGLFLGFAALRLLGALSLQDLPRASEIRIDGIVTIATVAIATAIGIVLGMIRVASLLGVNAPVVLTGQSRGTTPNRGARLLRRTLVVMQIAFALVLLVGAGLLFASFRRVLAVDPGFSADRVLTAAVNLPQTRYSDDPMLIDFAAEAQRQMRALPGVSGVGATDTIPFGGSHSDSVIIAEGYDMQPGESVISPNKVVVSPGYFEAIGATLLRGRFFDSRDGADGAKAIVVDEKLARRFWPDHDPIGRRMFEPEDINNLLTVTDQTVFFTVVGVVREIKLANLVDGNGEVGTYYFPSDQRAMRRLTFAVKASVDPAALASSIRQVINGLDPELPVFDVQTMSARMKRSLATRRSPMLLAIAYGAVALLLSAIGVYGVLAYLVAQRRKEIAIRIALGSSIAAVFQLVIREGLLLVAAGLLLGSAGVFALRRSLDSLLFGVGAMDATVLAAVTAMLAVVALTASSLPAWRATRIDPLVALTE